MWQKEDGGFYRKFVFSDFKEASLFLTETTDVINRLKVYPQLSNNDETVEVWIDIEKNSKLVIREFIQAMNEVSQKIKNNVRVIGHEKVIIYADGGSRGNPGPSASGFVIMNESQEVLLEKGVYLGLTTNNQAEYQALKLALEEAVAMHAQSVDVYMDSMLVVNQIKGSFKVKNRDLWPIHDSIKKLITHFHHATFTQIPRELNKKADAAVNRALDEALGISR